MMQFLSETYVSLAHVLYVALSVLGLLVGIIIYQACRISRLKRDAPSCKLAHVKELISKFPSDEVLDVPAFQRRGNQLTMEERG